MSGQSNGNLTRRQDSNNKEHEEKTIILKKLRKKWKTRSKTRGRSVQQHETGRESF